MNEETGTRSRPVVCPLCGGHCWFDDRMGLRIVAGLCLWLGWFAVPLLVSCIFHWFTAKNDEVGTIFGLLSWAVICARMFLVKPVWVCKECGALFPAARKVAAHLNTGEKHG
jgi:hypothetical protein